MNEQVIDDLYARALQSGYKKGRADFVQLIQSNDDVFNDMYQYVQSKGYAKDAQSFSSLVGKRTAPTVKKKVTASVSEPGSLVSPEPQVPVAETVVEEEVVQPVVADATRVEEPVLPIEQIEQPDLEELVVYEDPGAEIVAEAEGEKNTWVEDFAGKNFVTDFFGDIYRAGAAGQAQGASVDESLELMTKGKDVTDEDIEDFIAAQERMASQGESDEMKEFNKIYEANGSGWLGFLKGTANNPTVLPQLFVSSVSAMLTPATLAAGAAGAGTGAAIGATGFSAGPLGAFTTLGGTLAGAMGAMGTTLETGLAFSEFLQEQLEKKGLEMTTEGIRKVLEDPEAIKSMRYRAAGRGITIGAFNAVTAGVGSQVVKSVAKATGRKVVAGLAGAGVEVVSESAGEVAGRLVAGQEMDVAEIGFEGFAGGPAQLVGITRGLLKSPTYKINNETVSGPKIADFIKNAPIEDLTGATLEIKNDPVLKDIAVERRENARMDAIIKAELTKAGITDEGAVTALTKLEKERRGLEGNGTRAAQQRLAKVNKEIDSLMDGAKIAYTETVDASGDKVTTEVIVTKEYAKEELIKDGIESPTEQQVEAKQAELFEEAMEAVQKPQEDAIQEPSPETVDAPEPTRGSEEVGEGVPDIGEPTAEVEAEDQVAEAAPTAEVAVEETVPVEVEPVTAQSARYAQLLKDTPDSVVELFENWTKRLFSPEIQAIEGKIPFDRTRSESAKLGAVTRLMTKALAAAEEAGLDNSAQVELTRAVNGRLETQEAAAVVEETVSEPTQEVTEEEQVDIDDFFSDKEIEGVDKVDDNLVVNRKQLSKDKAETASEERKISRIKQIAKKAAVSLKKQFPDVRIVLHETEGQYKRFAGKRARGAYVKDDKTKTIHINLSIADLSTVPHEVFHALLLEAAATDPQALVIARNMLESVRKVVDPNSEMSKVIEKFVAKYEDVPVIQDEEYLAELMGILSSQYRTLDKPSKNAIKEFLRKLAKLVGIDTKFGLDEFFGPEFLERDEQVIDLLNTISGKVSKGQFIEAADVKTMGDILAEATPAEQAQAQREVRDFKRKERERKAAEENLLNRSQEYVQDFDELERLNNEGVMFHFGPVDVQEVIPEKLKRMVSGYGVYFVDKAESPTTYSLYASRYGKRVTLVDGSGMNLVDSGSKISKEEFTTLMDTFNKEVAALDEVSPEITELSEYLNELDLDLQGANPTWYEMLTTMSPDLLPSDSDFFLGGVIDKAYNYTNPQKMFIAEVTAKALGYDGATSIIGKGSIEEHSTVNVWNFDKVNKNIISDDAVTPRMQDQGVAPRQQIADAATSIQESLKFADKSSLPNKLEFKRALQERFDNEVYPLIKERYGVKDNRSNTDQGLKDYLVDAYLNETLTAIEAYPDALGWYDARITGAMSLMEKLHPELATDKDAASTFKIALAITSNGNKVYDNFVEANRQYEYFKENGKFDDTYSIGDQRAGILSTLAFTNKALESMSMADFTAFLTTKYRAGDLKYMKDGKKTPLLPGFAVDEEVYGASIFGPKIGNGFFMNLYGEFNQLTMDRWFMRQFGRLTGTLLDYDQKKVDAGTKRLNRATKALAKRNGAKLSDMIPGWDKMSAEELSNKIQKASMDLKKRAIFKSNPKLDEVRKAGNNLSKQVSAEVEAPRNSSQRKFINEVFTELQAKLKNDYDIDITIADLQAVNWYPEKALYQTFKADQSTKTGKVETSDNEQPDYESAAKKLVEEQGVSKKEIKEDEARRSKQLERNTANREAIEQRAGELNKDDIEASEVKRLKDKIISVKEDVTSSDLEEGVAPRQQVVYHVTIRDNKGNIQKKGLEKDRPPTFAKGVMGTAVFDTAGKSFAFSNLEDATKWGIKTKIEKDKEVSIVAVNAEGKNLQEDKAVTEDPFNPLPSAVFTEDVISPSDILSIEDVDYKFGKPFDKNGQPLTEESFDIKDDIASRQQVIDDVTAKELDTPLDRQQRVFRSGDLENKAEPRWKFRSSRETGHFGTGFYFFGTKEQADKYDARDVSELDIDKYNLAKATKELHQALRVINDRYNKYYTAEAVDELKKEPLRQAVPAFFIEEVAEAAGMDAISEAKAEAAATEVTKALTKDGNPAFGDSVSTLVMKSLGFDGVNAVGTSLDNSKYGTVIYDLKEDIASRQQLSDIATPLPRQQKSVREVVQQARDNNFKDAATKDFLKRKGVPTADIDKAIKTLDDVYARVMKEIDGVITKSQKRGVDFDTQLKNALAYLQGTKLYEDTTDIHREKLMREVRAKFDKKEKRAPSAKRILGNIKDVKKVTLSEKEALKMQLRLVAKTAKTTARALVVAGNELTKSLKEMVKGGVITANQMSSVLRRFSRVDLFNPASIDSFLDYMAKIFADAEYGAKIARIKKLLPRAKKNIKSKIGVADVLGDTLTKLFNVNPTLIPMEMLEDYQNLLEMMGAAKKVLPLADINDVTEMANKLLNAVYEEVSMAEDLAEVFANYENKVIKDGKVDYAATIEAMIADQTISLEEAAVMRKYKSRIVEPTKQEPKTEEELAEERAELMSAVEAAKVNVSRLVMDEERTLARQLAKLMRTEAIERLSNQQLETLLAVIDNINNGFVTHAAQRLVEAMNASNRAGSFLDSIVKAVPLPVSTFVGKIKAGITKNNKFFESVKRNPLAYIDQVFGDFQTTRIYDAIFKPLAQAYDTFSLEMKRVDERLTDAQEAVMKSFKNDPNKARMSSYKMMAYMLQREFEANPDNKQVNPAADFIRATIDHINKGQSFFKGKDAEMLQQILDDFGVEQIDSQKLYDSFNKAERNALAVMEDINKSMGSKAVFTGAVIRGRRVDALNQYAHHNVLSTSGQMDRSADVSIIEAYNQSMRASTKAKNLIERTGAATPLNFDVFSSVSRGSRFTLTDFYLTEPIRTSRKTISDTRKLLEERGDVTNQENEIINAVENALELTLDDLLTRTFSQSTMLENVVQYVKKTGYRLVLASGTRAMAEGASNLAFAAIYAPKDFAVGRANKTVLGAVGIDVMSNLKSTQLSRMYPNEILSGRMIDTSVLGEKAGDKGGRAKSDVLNKATQIYNGLLAPAKKGVEVVADTLISYPDKAVIRPLWFGSFENAFVEITGKKPDFEKIAANDEAYMAANQEALNKATDTADQVTTLAGAADNPFKSMLRGKYPSKAKQTALLQFFNNFNSFMTRFLIYEYISARTAVNAMLGNGMISKRQGAALLGAVTTRMIVYTLAGTVLNQIMKQVFGLGDEEDEKDIEKQFGQALASTATSLIVGRDFGNVVKGLLNYGVENLNEEFLDELREGDYDPYRDAIAYTFVPPDREYKSNTLSDYIRNLMGPFGPFYKMAEFGVKTLSADEKKDPAARIRQQRELNERLPLELLGNLGLIPLYRDIRALLLADIYKGMGKEKKGSSTGMTKAEKAQMKEYFPEMYEMQMQLEEDMKNPELERMMKEQEKAIDEMMKSLK